MTKHDEQSTDETAAEAPEREAELDEAELEDVNGGAGFLVGSLTAEQNATAEVGVNGFIMSDSRIVPTSRR